MSAHNFVLIRPVIVVWTKAVDRPNGIAVQLARLEIEPIKQQYKVTKYTQTGCPILI